MIDVPLPGMPDQCTASPDGGGEAPALTLDQAVARSHRLLDEVTAAFPAERVVTLFSGGNDSTVLAHLMRDRADLIVHVNTGTGVPDTTRYVRDVAAAWGTAFTEAHPPDSYRDLVLGCVVIGSGPNKGKAAWRGFPGPAGHPFMYQRLKERALEQVRRDLVGPRGRRGQLVFLAGMRWTESVRRFRNAAEIDVEGAVVWCSPLVHWTDELMAEYRARYSCPVDHRHAEHRLCHPGALPFNEVTAHLHMSGECLCGSYAKQGEIHGLELFYPQVAEQIHALERDLRAQVSADRVAGRGTIPDERCTWGWGATRERAAPAGRLCSTCAAPAGQLALPAGSGTHRHYDASGRCVAVTGPPACPTPWRTHYGSRRAARATVADRALRVRVCLCGRGSVLTTRRRPTAHTAT